MGKLSPGKRRMRSRQRPSRCTVNRDEGLLSSSWNRHLNDIQALKNPLALRSVAMCLRWLEVSDSPAAKEVNREAHSHLITIQLVSREYVCICAIVLTRCQEKQIHNGCYSRAEGGILHSPQGSYWPISYVSGFYFIIVSEARAPQPPSSWSMSTTLDPTKCTRFAFPFVERVS